MFSFMLLCVCRRGWEEKRILFFEGALGLSGLKTLNMMTDWSHYLHVEQFQEDIFFCLPHESWSEERPHLSQTVDECSLCVNFPDKNCWHTSPVNWPLSVPLCQCALLIRDCTSRLSIIQSVWSKLLASGHNFGLTSSTEDISHHFITILSSARQTFRYTAAGDLPQKPVSQRGHALNATGSKSKSTAHQALFSFFWSYGNSSDIKCTAKPYLHHLLSVMTKLKQAFTGN